MSRFGWAYVNSLITGAVANGPTNSIQFNSGSQILSGSSNFIFDPSTNKVTLLGQLTGSTLVISASVVSASTYLGISAGGTPGGTNQTIQFNSGSAFSGSTNLTFDYTTNTLFLTGTLRADTLIVSSSQILKSGSTIFGDDTADTHQFTGSIFNTTLVSGTTAQFTTISGSVLSVTGVSTLDGQVRAFGGIQARNSNISVTNLAGTTTLATMTTAGLVSGSTAQFTTITGSSIQTNGISLTGALLMSGTSGQAYISEVDYIDFDVSSSIPAYKLGRMFYDTDTQDLAYYLTYANQKLEIGQQTVIKVKNSTGSSITKGKIVHITGAVGDNPLVATASWENDNNSANTLGMLMSTVSNGDFGYVLLNGVITDVNTDPAIYSEGQVVYLSSSGDYTNVTPIAPNHTVRLGQVLRAHAVVGSIYIKIDNGYEIDELHNVLITSASAGDLLVYNSSSALWQNNKSLTGSYTITGSLTATATISGSTGTFTTITGSTITGSTGLFGVVTSSAFSGGSFVGTTVSGTTAQFTTITGSTITGSTGLFTTITGSDISASNQLQVAGTSFLNSNVNIGGNILGSAGFKANYATFSTSFTASSLSYFVGVSTTGSVVTASLNSAANYPAGQTLIFKDVGGNAATNNIRIQPSGSQTLDGATSLIISNTSGSATLVSNGVDGFYIVGLT